MMEIGWYFYQINYTQDEENKIESQRKLRERKVKEKKNQQSKKGSSKSNGGMTSLDQTPTFRGSVNGGLHIPKPTISQARPPVDVKRITKLKTRWDKSSEQLNILKPFYICLCTSVHLKFIIYKISFQNQTGMGAKFSKQI